MFIILFNGEMLSIFSRSSTNEDFLDSSQHRVELLENPLNILPDFESFKRLMESSFRNDSSEIVNKTLSEKKREVKIEQNSWIWLQKRNLQYPFGFLSLNQHHPLTFLHIEWTFYDIKISNNDVKIFIEEDKHWKKILKKIGLSKAPKK
ncbi:MAG: hypothetical protein RBG13Loki_0962 [Promethearchaeota archaeon CR_4]|nr:MAG: hypothetical protein RBG13Loki_0962 [Candidatus Lokiarchaeota archaeon CR_4]